MKNFNVKIAFETTTKNITGDIIPFKSKYPPISKINVYSNSKETIRNEITLLYEDLGINLTKLEIEEVTK